MERNPGSSRPRASATVQKALRGDSVQHPSTWADSEGPALKRHELRRAILKHAWVLAAILFPVAFAHAETVTPIRRNPNASATEEARVLAQSSGVSDEQLRQRLRDMGQSEADIDRYLQQPGTRTPSPNPPNTSATGAPASQEPPIRADSLAANPVQQPPSGTEPFGFEIFRYSPTTFEPLSYGPVDANYPLGPGDEVVLTLWGDDQMTLTLTVTREGFVTLPEVGQVSVSGVTLEEARVRVKTALARVYSGLRAGRATTFLSLSTGRLRTIQVFLLGQVVRPGGYTLSSVSRVLNALYAAGGPSRDGSLRDVRILRGNKLAASVDLYEVILGGASQQMERLQNGDVIFVPHAERRVTLAGPVRRTGLYELKQGEQLRDLLRVAGGLLPEADVARAQVDRIVPPEMRDSLRGQGRVAIDVELGRVLAAKGDDVPMLDADSLTVFRVPDRRANTLSINGRGISKPGVYEYRPGMRVSDLIASAGGVTPDAYLDRAQVTRSLPDSSRAALRFVPTSALAGDAAEDLVLHVLDDVSIRSKWDLQERQPISVHGLVRAPGTYELLEGMTLIDLLMRAGGLTDDALAAYAEVARVSVNAGGQEITATVRVPLARDLTKAGEAAALMLHPHDAVFIRRDPDFREQEYVTVLGEVRFPGTYSLTRRDERMSELVQRAGGLTPLAYAKGASFLRQGTARLAVDLPGALKRGNAGVDLVLLKGDTLHVPRFTPTVQVEGAVLNPVTSLYQPGAGIGYYITQASGLRQDADRRGVVVISPSGRVRKGGEPEPGSRIVVPARITNESKDHLKDFATLMSILASAATTVYLVGQSGK